MNYDFEKKQAKERADQEKKDAVAATEVKRQETIRNFIIAGLTAVLVFALFIFRSLRLTRKQKNIIELKSRETEEQKKIVEKQKQHIEEKHKEVTDSIRYARRIQLGLLPTEKYIGRILKNKGKT